MSTTPQRRSSFISSFLKTTLRMTRRLLIASVVVAALFVTLLSVSGPLLERHKEAVGEYISDAIHAQVSIGRLHVSWYAFQPLIRLDGVQIQSNKSKLLTLKRFYIGLNWWRSIWEWRWQPGLMILDGAVVDLRQSPALQNMIHRSDEALKSVNPTYESIVRWLFHQREVRLRRVMILLPRQSQPLTLQRLRIDNYGQRHRIELFAEQPKTDAERITIKMLGHFSGDSLRHLTGKYYLHAHQIPFDFLNPWIAPLFAAKHGTMTAALWGKWQSGFSSHNQVRLSIARLAIQNLQNKHIRRLPYLQMNATVDTGPHHWSVMTSDLHFTQFRRPQHYKVSIKRNKSTQLIQLNKLNLQLMQPWFNFLGVKLPSPLADTLLKGELKNFQINYRRKKILSVFAHIEDLAWYSSNGLSLTHLSGDLYHDHQHGHLILDSHNVEAHLPGTYQQTLAMRDLSGDIYWQKIDGVWRVVSDNVLFANPDLRATQLFRLDLHRPWQHSDLSAESRVVVNHLETLKPLLPVKQMNPRLYNWLSRAIIKVPKATIKTVFKGRLADFPFDNGNGHFSLDASLSGGTLRYHPEWPVASDIYARIAVSGRNFVADIHHALMGETTVHNIEVTISPIGTASQRLMMTTDQQLPIQKALNYVMQSRLRTKLNGLKQLQFTGDGRLDLQLQLGLTPQDNEETFIGIVKLPSNRLSFIKIPNLVVEDTQGELVFNQRGIEYSLFRGQSLGGQTGVGIKTVKQAIVFEGKGKLAWSKFMPQLLPSVSWLPSLLQGQMSYQWSANIADSGQPTTFVLHSQLKDTALNFPKPLHKNYQQTWPLIIKGRQDQSEIDINVSIQSLMHVALKLSDNTKLRLDRAAFNFGKKTMPALPDKPGIIISGTVPYLSLDDWAIFVGQFKNTGDSSSNLNLPSIDIDAKKLVVFFREYGKTHLTLSGTNKDFTAHLQQTDIFGDLRYQQTKQGQGELNIDMARVRYRSNVLRVPSNYQSTKSRPNVTVRVQHFAWNDYSFGKLEARALAKHDGFHIESISLGSPALLLRGAAEYNPQSSPYLSLNGYAYSKNIGQVFRQFHLAPIIVAQYGMVNFRFKSFQPPATDRMLSTLNGDLSFDIRRGRITHLSKEAESKIGLGKLVSILSLQTIPRRMILDFSDLSHKGYSFDRFKGDLTLNHGQLSTKNAYVNGPVAYVQMQGALNLLRQRYDMTLKVVPHVAASLPVVATLAGGPVAGVATWLASKILYQGMSKISAYTYHIDGPWDAPVVQQVSLTKAPRRSTSANIKPAVH